MAKPSSISINFKDDGTTAIKRSERGNVYLILQNADILQESETFKVFTVLSQEDIPKGLTEDNISAVKLALNGSYNAPSKVVLIITAVGTTDIKSEAFAYLDGSDCDYFAIPFIQGESVKSVADWVKERNNKQPMRLFKGVLPNVMADNKHVINVTNKGAASADKKELSAGLLCALVAGMRAGCPMSFSLDNFVVKNIEYTAPVSRIDAVARVEKGEFFFNMDRGQVRVVADVNSLTTIDKVDESYQQNKEMDIMDTLYNSLMPGIYDQYIGKFTNSYQNKLILVSAIKSLLMTFENQGLIEVGDSIVELDLQAQKVYLRGIGYKTFDGRVVDNMTDDEILKANTKDHVFVKIRFMPLGAIRHVDILVLT